VFELGFELFGLLLFFSELLLSLPGLFFILNEHILAKLRFPLFLGQASLLFLDALLFLEEAVFAGQVLFRFFNQALLAQSDLFFLLVELLFLNATKLL